jgi:hypothetical protein
MEPTTNHPLRRVANRLDEGASPFAERSVSTHGDGHHRQADADVGTGKVKR